jgi:hypothetical protein
MKKIDSNLSSIVHLSRAQTAKMRKTLVKTLQNIKTRRNKDDTKLNPKPKRPKTTSSYFSHRDMQKINPIYLPTNENNYYNKTTTRTKYSRPNTSNGIPRNNQSNKITEKNENHKTYFNEMQILNLFNDKQRDKNDDETNDDYMKKIQYKKLIMRAKLLKAIKYNIILKEKQFEEFNQKYSSGNKYLGEKLRNRGKIIKNDSDDDYSDSDSASKPPERPNFNSIKHPDIFSTYEFTSLFQDFHCTPLELIKKVFNSDEQKIINLDPIYFRLNKEPFTGVQKNLRFCLKDKINEEDKILLQKIKQARERNKRFYYLRKKKEEKFNKKKKINKENIIENEKNENENDNDNEENLSDNDSDTEKKNNKKEKRENSTFNKIFNFNLNKKKSNSNKKKKLFKIKGNNYLGIKVKKMKNKEKEQDNKLILNLNTDYNVYLETHRSHNRKKTSFSNPIITPIDDEEKISEKKKRLTMQEFFEMYNERKKTYLDDLSYNRTKKKYKYDQLRKEHCESIANEHEKKENLRKIMLSIEQNYKRQNHHK